MRATVLLTELRANRRSASLAQLIVGELFEVLLDARELTFQSRV